MTFAPRRSTRLLIEAAPVVWVLTALWCKFVYFSLAKRNGWWFDGWMPEIPLTRWAVEHFHLFTATLAVLLVMLSFVSLLLRLPRALAAIAVNLMGTTLVLANLLNAAWYGDVLSVWNLAGIENAAYLGPSVMALLRPAHFLLYLDILLALIAFPFWWSLVRKLEPQGWTITRRMAAAFATSGVLLFLPTARLIAQDDSGALGFATLQRDVCDRIGLLPYHIWDISMRWLRSREEVNDSDRARVFAYFAERRAQTKAPSPLFGKARGRNVIMISAESLQSYVLGLEVAGQAVAPRLTAFAAQSLNFTKIYDQSHLGTTADGEFMAMQSLYPIPVGVVVQQYYRNRYHALPEIVSQQGYTTSSAVAEPGWFWIMNVMHAGYGIQRSYFEDSFRFSERIYGWGADHEFFPQAVKLLASQKRPFFAYWISSSTHHPWELPRPHQRLKLGTLAGTELGRYLQSVNYFDRVLGELLDSLQASGLLNTSIVALYGDHQSLGGEPDLLAQLNGFAATDRFALLTLRKNIPLLIRLPGGEAAGARDVAGGQLDIAPTLLALLGIEPPAGVMLGTDLTRGDPSLVVFRDGSFTDGKNYLINRLGPLKRSSCFELTTSARVDCEPLREKRLRALERLEISDLVLHGDLIPELLKRERAGL